jgi:hypothetical protein
LFPFVRSIVWWLLIVTACWLLLLLIGGIAAVVLFSRSLKGPKSLSGTRCRKCGKRRAMQETSREFLHGNVKFKFDHYRIEYRCVACGHEEQQEELVDLKR